MKLFFRIILAVVLLFVWTVVFAYGTQFFYFKIWGFNPFNLPHWQMIPERWVQGWVIDTPSEFFFFFCMLLAVILFFVGYVILLKVPYLKLITLPFRRIRDKRAIEKRRQQDAFPGLDKMISDLKAKQGKDGKISKSKMPRPVGNIMPSVSRAQKPVQSKIKKEHTKPEEDIINSFRSAPEAEELPKKKTAHEFTDYSGFDEKDFDFKPFEKEESKQVAEEISFKPDIPEVKDFAPAPVADISTPKAEVAEYMSVAEPKVISRVDMKYETLMLAEKVGLDIVQDLKIGSDTVDFAIMAKSIVYLINFEPIGKEWVADEASFDDDEPLWFSEAKYDVSPVFRLNRAAKRFDNVLQDIMAAASVKIEVKKMLLVGGAAVLNYADIKPVWDEAGVVSLRLSTGRPAEIPELSSFLRKLAEKGSDSEEITDMIYTAFVAVEP